MLHLGISSARNPLALRVGLHSRLKSGIRILVAVSATSKCRGLIPRLFFYLEAILARDLSIFVDESGDRSGKARYYLFTLVIHDQSESIAEKI